MSTMGEPIVDPTSAYFNNDEEDDDSGSDTNEETDQDVETVTTAEPVTPVPPPKVNPNPNPSFDNGTSQSWSFVPGSSDESRRLFQRLWTDEEEIRILRGFLEFTSRRGTTFASHQYDTGPFYEEIKKQFTFDFSKNQLIEKLRRLKKKYRVCALRMQTAGKDFSFKSAHEQNIYDVARHIWRPEMKRDRESDDEDGDINHIPPVVVANHSSDCMVGVVEEPRPKKRVRRRSAEAAEAPDTTPAVSVQVAGGETEVPVAVKLENFIPVLNDMPADATKPTAIEETVKSCLSPLFKELINTAINSGMGPTVSSSGGNLVSGFGLGFGVGLLNPDGLVPIPKDEKWRKQQIMELEVYLRRIELLQDHVKSTLEELRSAGS
ncbi:Mediator-associated protein 1 [Carex littledalei]|uniref:Mediator-associated protein 1 n=1 Tax=Carex littledalei TaxID=544730 RepID=A0A833R7F9_9POAL|nr:Mediator-associated protein 1 [Carex littledalei]